MFRSNILVLLVVFVFLVSFNECGKFGRGRWGSRSSGGRSSGGWGSRPSPSRPSPSYGWNIPAHRPAPVPSPRPASSPSYGWNTQHPSPHRDSSISAITSRPSYAQPPSRVSPIPSAPLAPNIHNPRVPPVPSAPLPPPKVNHNPVYSNNYRPTAAPPPRLSTPRNIGWNPPAHSSPRPGNFYPTHPRHSISTVRPIGMVPPRSTSSWGLPPRPGHYPQGPPQTYYPAGHSYQGPSKVKYVTNVNYNYPVPHNHYPGYFSSPSYYRYSSFDTGSTALGLYLGYSLGRLTTPTYSHYSFYDGYRPRYDHYTVHHYYHNRDSVPPQQEIRPNNIVGCVGDAAGVCPSNTISLCTSSGTLMCVVNAASTMPCADNRQINCVQSTISCVNNTAAECKNAKDNTTTISIPCVSNATVYGKLQYVNNTIIVDMPNNGTNVTVANENNVTISNENVTVTTAPEYTTKYPITTTPVVDSNSTATPRNRTRRELNVPQNFCVTVLAVPAQREPTEGEKTFESAKFIFTKFVEKAWGL